MKRGEIWTSADNQDYSSKPRPVVIIQNDRFDETESIIACLFTSDPTSAPEFRIPIMPNDQNGLKIPSRIMVDKIVTIRRSKLRMLIGQLEHDDLVRLERALSTFLGIGGLKRGQDDPPD